MAAPPPPEDLSPQPHGPVGPTPAPRAKPPLLVVDDEPDVLTSVRDLFRREYRVIGCASGPEALEVLKSTTVPVIMTDQRMPGMSGVEFLTHARQIQPEATRLLFTGFSDLKAVVDAINEGHVFRYISKPWDPEELQAIVRQAQEQNSLVVERNRLIEELKRSNAQLLEANRLKDVFLEVASHELNTPVAVVLGMAELWLMMTPNASDTERAWLERIQRASRRLAETVERMIKLHRADRLGDTLALEQTDLAAMIQQTVAELAMFLQVRDQRIEFDLAPGLGHAVIDAHKISDVLTNLLINAVKFTPDGGTIRVAAGDEPPASWWLEVADQGKGIDAEEQKHLFQPFFTGFDTIHHSSGDFQYGKRGLGLGLSLVKSFVELHGGKVELQSQPGHGTRVRVHLPRSHERLDATVPQNADSSVAGHPSHDFTI